VEARDAVLGSAGEVFAAKGYAGATSRDLARAAGPGDLPAAFPHRLIRSNDPRRNDARPGDPMTETETSRTTQWQPPPRPEWVQRVNEEGACMNLRGVVPLDAE
jgi:hypothetical protein